MPSGSSGRYRVWASTAMIRNPSREPAHLDYTMWPSTGHDRGSGKGKDEEKDGEIMDNAAKNVWTYSGDFNELSSILIYGLTMKRLVDAGRMDEVNDPVKMTAAAKEFGITKEKIAVAMETAGRQMKEALALEKDLESVWQAQEPDKRS